jgi:hypothetical protein
MSHVATYSTELNALSEFVRGKTRGKTNRTLPRGDQCVSIGDGFVASCNHWKEVEVVSRMCRSEGDGEWTKNIDIKSVERRTRERRVFRKRQKIIIRIPRDVRKIRRKGRILRALVVVVVVIVVVVLAAVAVTEVVVAIVAVVVVAAVVVAIVVVVVVVIVVLVVVAVVKVALVVVIAVVAVVLVAA